MGFSAKQVQALRRQPSHRHIRTREAHGRELSYLEGWYAISEANRIFGFDGWNRETVESKCVLARENRGTFLAVYIARVRVTVQADGATIIREGHGTGEGHGTSPGEVHDIALKAAETDATKRALTTFGRPFGLGAVCEGKATSSAKALAPGPQPVDQATTRSGCRRTTRPLFRDRLAFMAVARIWSRGIAAKLDAIYKASCQQTPRLSLLHLPSSQRKSTRAFSLLPSQGVCATKRICVSSPHKPVSSVAGSRPIRITCVLPNHGRWVLRSATSSLCRSAADIIGNCTKPAMKWPGGPIINWNH